MPCIGRATIPGFNIAQGTGQSFIANADEKATSFAIYQEYELQQQYKFNPPVDVDILTSGECEMTDDKLIYNGEVISKMEKL